MSIKTANLLFQLFVLMVVGIGVYQSLDWPRATALLPNTIGSLVMVLLAIVFVRGLLAEIRAGNIAASFAFKAVPEEIKATVAELVWLLNYGLAIWLLGFYPATFLYLFIQLNIKAGFSLLRSLVWSLVATAVSLALFYGVLSVPPYKGLAYSFMQ